jgi:hypothetical protein
MAASHGANTTKVYCGGRDLSPYLKEAAASGEFDKADKTTFTSSAREYVSGLADGTFNGSGVYDALGTVGVDAIFTAAIAGSATIFEHFPAGDVIGSRGVGGGAAPVAKYEVKSPVEDVNMIDFDVQSSTGFESLIVHQELAAKTGSGTATASVDASASSANGGAGYIQCTALTGGTATVKIQLSSNDSAYSDLITFTITSAGTAVRTAVTGAVNRYTRAIWTVTGGTATFHTAFGRNP